jgi:hypothetical protein
MSDSQDDFSSAFGVMPGAQGSPTAAAPATNTAGGPSASGSSASGSGAGGSSASGSGAGGLGAHIGGSSSSMPPPLSGAAPPRPAGPLLASDFLVYSAKHKSIYRPTREFWSIDGVNACFPAVRRVSFVTRLARSGGRVDSVTWHPNEAEIIYDKIAVKGGWVPQPGARTFNTYIPPLRYDGDAAQATRWVDHWKLLYPDDYKTIIAWLAHLRQRPGIKPNFCIVLAGDPGIGKDTLLCPMRDAVGPWNCDEIQLHHFMRPFNDYQGGVFLRISEARDIGDGTTRGRLDRYALNDHLKPLLAVPPETFRLNRKWEPEYSAFNVCGVIITTNHPDALYVAPDDRRYFVVMSRRIASEFSKEFFAGFYDWYYKEGGIGHVIAYLDALDLSNFNPHEAPLKTDAFWDMVNADSGQEDSDLEDALDALGRPDPNDPEKIIRPDAVTTAELAAKAPGAEWLADAGKSGKTRIISRRMREAGYVNVHNPDTPGCRGRWKIKGRRVAIFALRALTPAEQLLAARQLQFRLNGPTVVQGAQTQTGASSSPSPPPSSSPSPLPSKKTETEA